jgi:flagellar M-ring protein FliF
MMWFEKRQLRLVLLVLAAVFVVLSAIYVVVFRVPYVPAYENIREGDAAAIVAELEAGGIPYRLENKGHDVLVPEDRAAEAQVLVAGADIPLGGTVGFELFNDSDMGLTEFAQKVNLQRALQGELARTIMSMGGVEFARVHLALPERSIFRSEQGDPTAAVTLQMKPGQVLSPQRIDGVRQLIAYSVPDLRADAVAILNENGDLVSGVPAADNGFGAPLTERAALEQYYETRARRAITAAAPGLHFQVTVSTRQPAMAARGEPARRHAALSHDQFVLNIMVRTRDELDPARQERIEAALSDTLGLDRGAGDALIFSIGLVSSPVPAPAPIPSTPVAVAEPAGVSDAGGTWDWLFSRWTLIALVLAVIAALIVRPRRQLDDEQAASFAELLKGGIGDRETLDAR